MTEEVKEVVAEVVTEGVTEPESKELEAPKLSGVEEQAYKEGWRPKEEYTKDPSMWIPADEFMRRKPLFEKIDSLKSESYQSRKELQEVKKVMTDLVDHHKKVRETEYKRAVAELRAERNSAIDDRDPVRVELLDEQLDNLKEEKAVFEAQLKQEAKTQVQVAPTPEYVEWVKENTWYNTNKEMHDFADGIGVAYLKNKPDATPNEVFSYVSKQAKRAYPEAFSQPRSGRPSPVDSGANESRQSSKAADDLRLSPEEEDVARRFERRGIMTRKEYAAQLKKIKG